MLIDAHLTQAILVVVLALLLCFPFFLFLALRAIKARRHQPKYMLVAKNLLSIYRPQLYWWVASEARCPGDGEGGGLGSGMRMGLFLQRRPLCANTIGNMWCATLRPQVGVCSCRSATAAVLGGVLHELPPHGPGPVGFCGECTGAVRMGFTIIFLLQSPSRGLVCPPHRFAWLP